MQSATSGECALPLCLHLERGRILTGFWMDTLRRREWQSYWMVPYLLPRAAPNRLAGFTVPVGASAQTSLRALTQIKQITISLPIGAGSEINKKKFQQTPCKSNASKNPVLNFPGDHVQLQEFCFSGSNVGIILPVLEQLHFVMKQQLKEGTQWAPSLQFLL